MTEEQPAREARLRVHIYVCGWKGDHSGAASQIH